MELVVDWNAVCLVCLQEGEMRSIFDKDEKDLSICDKIMRCSNIKIQKGMNLPEQICNICYDDLKIAYRFRTNCESSNVILKSFVNVSSNVIDVDLPSSNGQVYKYKPPSGLNVRRIKVAPKFEIKEERVVNEEEDDETIEEDARAEAYNSDDNYISTNEVIESYENEGNDSEMDDEIKEMENKDGIQRTVIKAEELNSSEKEIDRVIEKVFTESEDAEELEENQMLTIETEEQEKGEHILITEVVETKAGNNTRKRGRPRTKLIKSNVEVTPDNVSSMVTKLSSVAYVKKKKDETKPLKMCEICGNGYKYQHALDSHMRRHRNEKPYACEFCDRAFVANVELRRHMRVHTGQKPYACRYCARCFSDFGSRIKHERTHTGERPYECSTCGKAFAYAHVLSVHVLTHTGEKKFKCEICGKGFTKKSYLQGHLSNHHFDEKESQIIHEIQIIPAKTETEEILGIINGPLEHKVEYVQEEDD